MNLNLTLHLVAGVGAVITGGSVLLRQAGRARNRSFAALCVALAVWNLGYVVLALTGEAGWRHVMLSGSCAVAPLGLDFAMRLAAWPGRRRRIGVGIACVAATALWCVSWSSSFGRGEIWALLSFVVLGGALVISTLLLGLHAIRHRRGSDRRALLAVFFGAVVAVVGGMPDFIPRDPGSGFMPTGPLALLFFLLIVSVVLPRHRFLEADRHALRLVSLLAGSAMAAALFYLVIHRFDPEARFLTLLAVTFVVLAAAGPLGRLALTGASAVFAAPDPLARTLIEASQRLRGAERAAEVWRIVDESRARLAPEVRLAVHARNDEDGRYDLIHGSGPAATRTVEQLKTGSPLISLLESDGLPLTERQLELETDDFLGERRQKLIEAREQMERLGLILVAPVVGGRGFRGAVTIGGEVPAASLTSEVAAAFMAVGNQAAESLERIRALELAGRRETLAAVGELAAGLAHEVRNPLAAIRGASQVLEGDTTPEQQNEMLSVIGEETERLGRVVGDFLDYARPDSPRRESLDLGAIAREAIDRIKLGGVRTTLGYDGPGAAPAILGDPDQIRRAINNLLRNASEAAGPDGRILVSVQPDPDGGVSVRVEDDGPGISPEHEATLFQPFHTTKSGGTGLGLALVHRIVEEHRGSIRVEGRFGRGAVFTITLPEAL